MTSTPRAWTRGTGRLGWRIIKFWFWFQQPSGGCAWRSLERSCLLKAGPARDFAMLRAALNRVARRDLPGRAMFLKSKMLDMETIMSVRRTVVEVEKLLLRPAKETLMQLPLQQFQDLLGPILEEKTKQYGSV